MSFRMFVCVTLVATVCGVALGPSAAAAVVVPAGAGWRPPIDAPVTRGFAPPAHQFGPGHLGVDYPAPAGTPVRAAGNGVVAFAGVIAGAVHVVVAHHGNLRTSYSFLASASVHRGQHVSAGDVLGRAGGTGENHTGVVHFGLRVGDNYVDPMVLFRPPDLAKIVHLAPASDPVLDRVDNERRGLLAGLTAGVRTIVGTVASVDTHLARLGQREASQALQLAVHGSVIALGNYLDHLSVAPTPQDALRVAQRLVAWARSLQNCDPHAPAADGTRGSGNRVMVVAGINSSMSLGHHPLALPLDRLGYGPADIASFSYTDTGGDYGPRNTHEPIEVAARQLGEQLRAMERATPGKPVDLIAHSQGGVVVLAFLLLDYRPDDPTLPPLGNVVTLSSPLQGAPGASLVDLLAKSAAGRGLLSSVGFSPGGSVHQLEERSPLIRALDGARLPDQIELTTIGNSDDYVVTANGAHRDNAATFDVDTFAAEPHTAMLRDDRTLRAVRAALEHRPLPCQTFAEAIDAATLPTALTRIEHLGHLAASGNTR